jgi:hypothetical protein
MIGVITLPTPFGKFFISKDWGPSKEGKAVVLVNDESEQIALVHIPSLEGRIEENILL